MSKRILLAVIILIFSLVFIDELSFFHTEKTPIISEGSISASFCSVNNCETSLNNLLKRAKESIHCALFDLRLESTINLLLEKENAIDVKIVFDERNKKYVEGIKSAVSFKQSGLMHNKFCIIDEKIVFTGSFNPTERGAHKNNNNFLVIESRELAENYENEFNELWNNEIDKKNKQNSFIIDEIQIQNYFCPEDACSRAVQKEINRANKSIYFMTFSFTDRKIANLLVIKSENGLEVKGVFEKTQASDYSVLPFLKFQGIKAIQDNNKYNMHHKVFIIDNKTVITGSYNPSKNGNEKNDENILIIHDTQLTNMFLEEFKRVYN